METTLELLRRQYNYRLAERFSWWELNRCDINSCSIVSCSIAPLKNRPTYVSQANDLPNSKELFPEDKQIYSQVLQECLKGVDKAFDRFVKPDATGKRFGKPRFKGKGRYRSFTYPSIKQGCIANKRINLAKIGQFKLIQHRPLPDEFKIKTATVSFKSDGWYVALSLEDKSVPELSNDIKPTIDNTVGIDIGLNSFLVTSSGVVAHENLNIKNMSTRCKPIQDETGKFLSNRQSRKSGLNKSILDAGWGSFLEILKFKAERAGALVVEVNPSGTSQNCSGCGHKVPKTLKDRWHSCSKCGLEIGRDHNSAIEIRNRSVGHPDLTEKSNARSRKQKREAPTILLVS
jgi:putative transposase